MPSQRSTVNRRKNMREKLTEFKKYPKLPLELKNMIVKRATPTAAKVVVIGLQDVELPDGSTTQKAKARYQKPAFLDVDKSFRELVLKMFTAAFMINLEGTPVYFNFKIDALVYESIKAMAVFNGDYLGVFFEGPTPNQYPVVMVGFQKLQRLWLSPEVLVSIGAPAYFTFLHKSGSRPRRLHEYMGDELASFFADYENRGEEITKTYKAPKVSYRTPLQMLKLLVRPTLSPARSLFTLEYIIVYRLRLT